MRSPMKSWSAARSCGAGSATWWKCRSGSKSGSSSQCGPAQREPVHGALAEAVEARDDAVEEDRAAALPVDGLVEPQDAVDDHQVRRPVHPQPGGVGGGHGMPGAHGPDATPGPRAAASADIRGLSAGEVRSRAAPSIGWKRARAAAETGRHPTKEVRT